MKRPAELYLLYFLHLVLSLNALVGGGALILDPQGSLMGLKPEWLQNTPFNSYLVPGLMLFTLNGLLPLFALTSLLFKPNWHWANAFNIYADKYWAWTYSLFTGIILITWITVQVVLTHYFWLQPVFILLGLLIIICTLLPRVQKYYHCTKPEMNLNPLRISQQLTLIIILLAVIAAAGGLFLPGLYRDNAFYKTAWLGNDMVTLAVVVPLLVWAQVFCRSGSQRAYLVWMGLLGYLFYNYAFYMFGAAFNAFFPIYVALFSLSGYASILGLAALDVHDLSKQFRPGTPRKWLSGYLLLISLPLGIFEAMQCLSYIFTSKLPQVPSLIFALDLAIVVPNTALAAFLLWKKHPWGYVLGIIMLVKAFTYGLVLTVSTSLVAFSDLNTGWDPLMPFYVFVMVGGFIGSLILLKNLKLGFHQTKNRTHTPVVSAH